MKSVLASLAGNVGKALEERPFVGPRRASGSSLSQRREHSRHCDNTFLTFSRQNTLQNWIDVSDSSDCKSVFYYSEETAYSVPLPSVCKFLAAIFSSH